MTPGLKGLIDGVILFTFHFFLLQLNPFDITNPNTMEIAIMAGMIFLTPVRSNCNSGQRHISQRRHEYKGRDYPT